MARYRPLMRSEGMPTIAPISAAMSPPASRLTGHGESEPVGQVGRRVGAHRHERPVADRDLAGVADQDVEAQRARRPRSTPGWRPTGSTRAGQRDDQKEQHRERRHRPACDRQRVERHVGLVRRLQDAALAMDHAAASDRPSGPSARQRVAGEVPPVCQQPSVRSCVNKWSWPQRQLREECPRRSGRGAPPTGPAGARTPLGDACGGVHPLDDLLAEDAVGADHQRHDHQHVGGEVLGAAADVGVDVAGGHVLHDAHDQAAHDGARESSRARPGSPPGTP